LADQRGDEVVVRREVVPESHVRGDHETEAAQGLTSTATSLSRYVSAHPMKHRGQLTELRLRLQDAAEREDKRKEEAEEKVRNLRVRRHRRDRLEGMIVSARIVQCSA
jgi:hypothetical protein